MRYVESQCADDFREFLAVEEQQWSIAGANDFPMMVWKSYLYSPKMTDFGTRVPWVSSTNMRMAFSPVEVDRLPPRFRVEDYWKRIDLGTVDWGALVTGHDICISAELMTNGWSDFGEAANVEEINCCVSNLYAEAVAHKRGTIPRRATVEIRFGPFTHMELTEKGPNIFVVLRTATEEFWDVLAVPELGGSNFALPGSIPSPRREAITAEVNLLLAAVIRDFWVVEEREAVFGRRPISPRALHLSLPDKPSIVYLPRIRYQGRPNVQRCVNNLGHTERRLHAVVAHLRRLTRGRHASDQQKILARQYGFHCDEGYTFVAAHQRGRDKRDVIYRSQSALNSLYAVKAESTANGGPDRWFRFERDVHKATTAMELTVEHIAASRHGDQGIEVYATEGRDLDRTDWIVHCKCRHPKHTISAKVVRELAAVLPGRPSGTRGMVLTTSRFSAEAVEAARAANIRLVDGEEFRKLVESVVGNGPPYTNRLAG